MALIGYFLILYYPADAQLQRLEAEFVRCAGKTPPGEDLKELTRVLLALGAVKETNVVTWFNNKRARDKQVTRPPIYFKIRNSHTIE